LDRKGNDVINGGEGMTFSAVGTGNNTLSGGSGADTFVVSKAEMTLVWITTRL